VSPRATALGWLLLLATGCASAPTEEEARAARPAVSDAEAPTLSAEELDALREAGDLEAAHAATRRAVAAEETPAILWRMARAEADLVLVLRAAGSERRPRDLAALSGLLYARAAADAAPDDPAVLAQLAYALGTTTHLVPMFDRDDRANETAAAVKAALAADPANPTALLTQATLHLRLATLPWIAKLFAGDAPPADLELAERAARACVAARPSAEHLLLLGKVLLELDQEEEARAVLERARDSPLAHPRDRELSGAVADQLDDL
jgi:hypothetical protein